MFSTLFRRGSCIRFHLRVKRFRRWRLSNTHFSMRLEVSAAHSRRNVHLSDATHPRIPKDIFWVTCGRRYPFRFQVDIIAANLSPCFSIRIQKGATMSLLSVLGPCLPSRYYYWIFSPVQGTLVGIRHLATPNPSTHQV